MIRTSRFSVFSFTLALALVSSLAVTSGCRSAQRRVQFVVAGVGTPATLQPADIAYVRDAITELATDYGMADHSRDSIQRGTIAYFELRDTNEIAWCGARESGPAILVDVFQYSTGPTEVIRRFEALEANLNDRLQAHFGDRLTRSDEQPQVRSLARRRPPGETTPAQP